MNDVIECVTRKTMLVIRWFSCLLISALVWTATFKYLYQFC